MTQRDLILIRAQSLVVIPVSAYVPTEEESDAQGPMCLCGFLMALLRLKFTYNSVHPLRAYHSVTLCIRRACIHYHNYRTF